MKTGNIALIILFIIILIISWRLFNFLNPNFDKCFKQNITELHKKSRELNALVEIATNEISNKNLPNKAIDLDSASDELRKRMESLGFRSFRFESVENCANKYQFYFNVWKRWNIRTLNKVEIIYSPCDKETENGYHWFDGNHIDIFGAGGNWKILSDTDFI